MTPEEWRAYCLGKVARGRFDRATGATGVVTDIKFATGVDGTQFAVIYREGRNRPLVPVYIAVSNSREGVWLEVYEEES